MEGTLLLAHMYLLEKIAYNQGEKCSITDCKNQASWTVPARGEILVDHKIRLCESCIDKALKSEEVDDQGRLPMRLPKV